MIAIRTLRDYASAYQVHAYCSHCQHSARLDYMRIAQLVGWDATLSAVRRALRCSRCGSGGARVTISHDGRPAYGNVRNELQP